MTSERNVSTNVSTEPRYRYRHNGKLEKVSLGPYPALSLKAARAKRLEHEELLVQGESPARHRQAQKFAIKNTTTMSEFGERVRGGEDLVRRLFEPLGYTVDVQNSVLDEQFAEWGSSPYISLTLQATTKLKDLLTHIYVLVPVLDTDKHYFVSADEIDKLLRRGEGWRCRESSMCKPLRNLGCVNHEQLKPAGVDRYREAYVWDDADS